MRSVILLLLLYAHSTLAMRILAYFPVAVKSHHYVVQPIIRELANRGHYILYVSPFPMDSNHPNITLHLLDNYNKYFYEHQDKDFFTKLTPVNTAYKLYTISNLLESRLFKSEQFQRLIHSNDSYDLILHAGLLNQEHAAVFPHKFNAQSVVVLPFGDNIWANEMSGLTDNAAYMMGFQVPLTERMSFVERLYNAFIKYETLVVGYYQLYKLQSVIDEIFVYNGWETRPSIFQLVKNHSLILTASHHSVGYSFPRAPHVREVGGLSLKKSQSLPKEFELFISGAKEGVIYFSFGSVIRSDNDLVKIHKNVFLNVFKRLKQRVLLKWDEDIENPPENVLVSKWFPQQDILGHKNVKLFVTHGGLQSTFETVYHGVPVVSIPFFSDQRKNAKLAEYFGFGVRLENGNITEESFAWAVNEVIHNPRYSVEIKRRSALLRDRPMPPLDEAVYWIEYVHRHGSVLQPAAVHLSSIQFHLIDVYAFIIGVVVFAYVAVKYAISIAWKRIATKTKMKTIDAKKKNK